MGDITASGASSVTLSPVDGQSAEQRSAPVVGRAWAPGYRVAIVNAATYQTEQILTIDSVSGAVITFTEALTGSVTPTLRNSAGLIVSGHFLRYAEYGETSADQKQFFAYFASPETGYPINSSLEVNEQRAGSHNFPDGRQPYLLFPEDYTAF